MITKNIFGTVLAVAVLVAGVSVVAMNSQAAEVKVAARTPSPEVLSCVAAAVHVREASLSVAVGIHGNAVTSAYNVRASALADAYTKITTAEIKFAVKNAWLTFSTAIKASTRDWHTAQTSAWTTFKTSARACKDTSGISDSINSTKEVTGK